MDALEIGPPIVVLGATAAGKSALGLAMARRLGGEVVNADAFQVYRGLDVGTAKPPASEREIVPHHLLDLIEPEQEFSAGQYARLGRQVLKNLQRTGVRALIIGGSGLYLRSLLDGLAPMPPADLELRGQLRDRLAEEGLPALRLELERIDPLTAARLAPGDTQRTVRALEVGLGTGRALSSWLAQPVPGRHRIRAVKIGLTLPRAVLYDRISARVNQMVAAGWVGEVEALLNRGVDTSDPGFRAIGYKQLARHLVEGLSLEEAIFDIVRATKKYAKRQETWFKKDHEVIWLPAEGGSDGLFYRALELIN